MEVTEAMKRGSIYNQSGVYAIKFDGIVRYIGSSANMNKRRGAHLSLLRHNKYHNIGL